MRHMGKGFQSLLVLFSICVFAISADASTQVRLSNEFWSITVRPWTLRIDIQPKGGDQLVLLPGRDEPSEPANLLERDGVLKWDTPKDNVKVSISLDGKDLSVDIVTGDLGLFSFGVLEQSEHVRALIWPRAEGCYIPLDDKRWRDYLIDHGPWDTIGTLSMPFWGLDCGDYSVTLIATNPYNNSIVFSDTEGRLGAEFSHETTPFSGSNEFGFLIRLGRACPVEPARQFRRWLIEKGRFVSMAEKIGKVPKARRLAGAAHVYLWGDAVFSRHDIPRNKWRAFCRKLVDEARENGPSCGKRIKQLMRAAHWNEVVEISQMQWPHDYIKTEVANELSRLLGLKEFYNKAAWEKVKLPSEVIELLTGDRDALSPAELCRMNSLVLYAAYKQFMLNTEDWGNGVSLKMLRQFHDNGFDRLRLCVAGWEGIEKRPHVAAEADKTGYLFGTYDSYHSIHNPVYAGTDSSWPTAQFDQQLFETGPIVNKEGKKRGGFKKVGCKLSPIAARPYVEKRVKQNMSRTPYSYYFIDCDATGEVYDDYSVLHRAGQADDARARLDRLAWISDTYGVPVGSEGGNAFAAGVIHVAEGIFGPLVAWGDPDMNDKNSKYYKGGYYPPDGPKVFVKQVPLKPEYEYFYYDPRFRLPLYETVFHDSVVTTHWWGNGSLKFTTAAETVELTELLYMVAPMYHLNLDEFRKQQGKLKRHYDYFSPLHREVGFSRMTDFGWLSEDRLVQRTIFDDRVELVANFSEKAHVYDGSSIPARAVVARWKNSGKRKTYTPNGAEIK